MSFPSCVTAYVDTATAVSATGVVVSDSQLADIVQKFAAPILFDQEGQDALRKALEGVAETDFERSNLETVLSEPRCPQSWEVGEAVAQVVVSNHAQCQFPWPIRRDQRNPAANQPGSDLVGFQDTGSAQRRHRFAFGEVKTSRQKQYPPGVVHGRHGLTRQLKRLRDGEPNRHHIMKYLGYRAGNTPWSSAWKSASGRMLANTNDVSLFGVIVRDVPPNARDLEGVARDLANGCPPDTRIELRAVYLPADSIPGLARMVMPNMKSA